MSGEPVKFTLEDAERAYDEWGANCGPGALAAATGKTLDEVRPHLPGFDNKRYTNPTMMFSAMKSLGVSWNKVADWPTLGLVRVQWEGPWTSPGVPMHVRYRHTHWIASRYRDAGVQIFDINCMCVGGWVPLEEWRNQVVPWLLKEVEPKANGRSSTVIPISRQARAYVIVKQAGLRTNGFPQARAHDRRRGASPDRARAVHRELKCPFSSRYLRAASRNTSRGRVPCLLACPMRWTSPASHCSASS